MFMKNGAQMFAPKIAPEAGRQPKASDRYRVSKKCGTGPGRVTHRQTGRHREGRARGWGRPSQYFDLFLLFRDRAARNPVPCVACGIGLHVVSLRVNY